MVRKDYLKGILDSDLTYTAKRVKKELLLTYPDKRFSVSIIRRSWRDSILIKWKHDMPDKLILDILNKYERIILYPYRKHTRSF
jgi:S-adenosylmethionine:tRNA-ribosyltransferase-isomerase (queuine synthetase)